MSSVIVPMLLMEDSFLRTCQVTTSQLFRSWYGIPQTILEHQLSILELHSPLQLRHGQPFHAAPPFSIKLLVTGLVAVVPTEFLPEDEVDLEFVLIICIFRTGAAVEDHVVNDGRNGMGRHGDVVNAVPGVGRDKRDATRRSASVHARSRLDPRRGYLSLVFQRQSMSKLLTPKTCMISTSPTMRAYSDVWYWGLSR